MTHILQDSTHKIEGQPPKKGQLGSSAEVTPRKRWFFKGSPSKIPLIQVQEL